MIMVVASPLAPLNRTPLFRREDLSAKFSPLSRKCFWFLFSGEGVGDE